MSPPEAADLLEVYLPLRALASGPPPARLGSLAHGLFFSLLRTAAPTIGLDLGEGLHVGRPGLTASPLLDDRYRPARQVVRDQRYVLRFTFLRSWLAHVWQRHLAPSLPPTIRLGTAGRPRWVCDYAYDPAVAPATAFPRRFADLASPDRPLTDQWRLTFTTPTTFVPSGTPGSPRLSSPLPAPADVLASLGSAWRAFAPRPYRPLAAPERVAALSAQVQLGPAPRLDDETDEPIRLVALPDRGLVAFTGSVQFTYRWLTQTPTPDDLDRCRLLGALLDLGTFAGVGEQTTQGLGALDIRGLRHRDTA